MEEQPKPLDRETTDRMCREYDNLRNRGRPFRLIATVWPKPDGTRGDAIHIEVDGQPQGVIVDSEMTSDINLGI